MKKRLRNLLCVLMLGALPFCLAPAAQAREVSLETSLLEKSGASGLYDVLDSETKDLLEQAGVEDVSDAVNGSGVKELVAALSGVLREKLGAPLKALAGLVAAAALCKLASCFDSGQADGVVSFAGTLACAALVAVPLLGVLRSAGAAVNAAAVFLTASVPVYGALMAAAGSPLTGASYSFLTLAAGSAIPILSSAVLLPLLRVFLALALVSSVSQIKTDRLAKSLYGFSKWLLVLAVTLFSGVLSVQTALNAHVDAAANKAGKLLASAAIPIVGGAFGDAVAALQNSVGLVKSGVGAFGMLAALCVFAPPAIECTLWAAVCAAGQMAGDLFGAPRLSAFLGMCASAAKMILAVLAAACAVSLVSAAILIFVKGSGSP